MTDIFNTREIAIGIWIVIGLLWFASLGKGRKSLIQLVRAILQWRLVIIYLAIFIYCGVTVYVLCRVNFWQWSFLKDTIMWTVLSGIGILVRYEQRNGFKNQMKKYIRDAISVTAIVVFVSSAYTFNIWVELISVPILVMFGGAQVYAENDPRSDYKRVAKFLQALFVAYGLIAISFSLRSVIGNYQDFLTTETLRNFLLPIVLLIAFIPFYYAFALYSIYEVVFIQLKWPTRNDKSLVKYLKLKLRKYVGINLFKMERFCQYRKYATPFLKSKEDVDRFFNWLTSKNIGRIIHKHNELSIDELPWDAVIRVALKDGTVVMGEYGHWTNAFYNEPNGESLFVMDNDAQHEIFVEDISSIELVN